MPEIAFLVPGPIDTRTGGYEYDRRMVAGLRRRGFVVQVHELDPAFPRPTAAALHKASAVLAGIPDGRVVMIDGLALGAMPIQAESEATRLRIVALVHLPLADEPGLDLQSAASFAASERRALAASSLVVVTGQATAAALQRAGVPRHRIAVVEPGTTRAPLARGSVGAPLHLLSVGALTPGKGHEMLIAALSAVPHRSWQLTCAGSLDRSPETVTRVRALLRTSGLDRQVSLAGDLHAASLEDCYSSADLFVLATLHETFCMAVAEALAHGLAVISTTTGAIPDLVGESAGLLTPPGDVPAMTAALTRVLGDAALREQLAGAARRVRDRLPTWDDAVANMMTALTRVPPATHVA